MGEVAAVAVVVAGEECERWAVVVVELVGCGRWAAVDCEEVDAEDTVEAGGVIGVSEEDPLVTLTGTGTTTGLMAMDMGMTTVIMQILASLVLPDITEQLMGMEESCAVSRFKKPPLIFSFLSTTNRDHK